jgi:zinc-ribbon family
MHNHPAMGEPPRPCWCFDCLMVVIFGFGPGKQEDLGEAVQVVCPNCHNQVILHHVRSKKTVRLYFVPVVPYGTDDYLVCPVCSRGMQLSQAQLPHVASVKRATAAFRAGRLSEADYAAQADRFWRAMGVHVTGRPVAGRPAAPPAAAPAPPPAAASAGQPPPAAAEETSWMAQLRKLAKLHEEGVLSDAHYESAKQRILEQM